MIKKGCSQIGCLSAIIILVAGITASAVSMTYQEFKAAPVTDSRMEASCHNFADNGAFYEFKIIGGRVYYSKEGGAVNEFSVIGGGPKYFDHTNARNNAAGLAAQETQRNPVAMPAVDMIAARDNRVLTKEAGGKRLFWAGIITEYKDDYKFGGIDQSVLGTYGKVDPEEEFTLSNPGFYADPRNHFGSSLFYNTNPITPPDVLAYATENDIEFAGLTMPCLSMISTTDYQATETLPLPAGPIFKDVMEVSVIAGRWYLIDARPPRNDLDANISELSGGRYNDHKKYVLKSLTGYMVKIITDLMMKKASPADKTNEEKIKDLLYAKVDDAASESKKKFPHIYPDMSDTWLGVLSGVCESGGPLPPNLTCVSIEAEVILRTVHSFIDNTANKVKSKLSGFQVVPLMNRIDMLYTSLIDYAIDHGYDSDAVATNLENQKTLFKNDVFTIITGYTEDEWGDDGLFHQDYREKLRDETDAFCDTVINVIEHVDTRKYIEIQFSFGLHASVEWTSFAKGIYDWYRYFQYPDDVFEMEDKTPYSVVGHPSTYKKTQVKIGNILGIGIAQACRFEHYRMHHGGDWGTFFGKIDSPESWDITLEPSGDPVNMFNGFDGHGFVDGTCNFYMLAEIQMKSPDETTYHPARALLWIDEQEFFAERWHVFHPRDNAFEGLPATLGAAFTSLTLFNNAAPLNNDEFNINTIANSFWTPYNLLSPNARMATSGTATVIADNDRIYSASIYWAITDETWRWRNYPDIDPIKGESIDKQSIKFRDDMTIYLKGKKYVNDELIDGYWFQRYLDPSNNRPPAAAPGVEPEPFTHPWHFMAKDAFEFADRNFFKMGMYTQAEPPSSDPSQHYAYKGYNPRTNVNRLGPKWGSVSSSNVSVHDCFNNLNVHPIIFVRADRYKDPNNCYYLYSDEALTKPITSPMYNDMKVQYPELVKPIQLKFVVVDYNVYAYFPDIRNDDIKLALTIPTGSENIYLRPVSASSMPAPIHTFSIKKTDLFNLNVWADAPINQMAITRNSLGETCGFQFTLNDYPRYVLTTLKVGYIRNGSVHLLNTIPLDLRANGTYNCSGGISQADWETYFSSVGRIKYGTSVWVEDAFGNSNAVLNLDPIGVRAPFITISATTSNGLITDKPAISGQPITFDVANADGAGAITSITWDFGDGTPPVTSLTPPVHRYTKPGMYVVTVTATGPDFPDVKKITITVRPNFLPLIRFLNG